MNLKEQQYVVTLADCGSISRAAEQLGITQPALSSYLSNLEHTLGAKLFERVGKRFVPTYAGSLYVESARPMLRLKQEFDAKLSNIVDGYHGRLKIGLQVRRAPWLIPSLLRIFSHYYPNVEVTLQESHIGILEEMLRNGEIDIMLANSFGRKQGLDYIFIQKDLVLLAVASGHPLAHSGRKLDGYSYPWADLSNFKAETFILNQKDQQMRRTADLVLDKAGLVPQKVMLIRSTEASVQLAAEGFGVCFTLESYARRTKYHKSAAYFVVGDPVVSSDFMVVHRKGMNLPDYIMQFCEILREIF